MSLRALCLEPLLYQVELQKRLELAGIECDIVQLTQQTELIAQIQEGYDIVFARLGLAFNLEFFLMAGERLRYLLTPTTGLSHIDLEAAKKYNVTVISLKDQQTFLRKIASTAEQTWALLLAVIRHIPGAHQAVLDGEWDRVPYRGSELSGKTLGIYGLGRLGSIVARYGQAFNMTVIGTDICADVFQVASNSHVKSVCADDLFKQADILSLHLPLNAQTEGIVGKRELEMLKPSAVLINTARGELIDESHLLKMLIEKRIAGVGLDVLRDDAIWNDKIPVDHPFIAYAQNHQNLVLSPHLGGYTLEAVTATRAFIVERLLDVLSQRE